MTAPQQTDPTKPKIVILGAGFAGLRVARSLRRTQAEVLVIDRQNHHLFQPLLYQVATAGLSAPDISAPIRRVLRKNKNLRVVYGEITAIDPDNKTVAMGPEEIAYDTLVVATGATHSYFGHEEWARFAPGLKTLQDAQRIRSRIVRAFESAERSSDPTEREEWLRFVVVGAGPTGVELAGAIAELSRRVFSQEFHHFDAGSAEVHLIEGADRVLGGYTEKLSSSAREQLEKLGVLVRTDSLVTHIDEHGVVIGTSESIAARTVIWAAGVQASPLLRSFDAPRDRVGRIRVDPDLTVPGYSSVYVIGDAAHIEQEGVQVPGVAPAAIQMGAHVSKSIRAQLKGKSHRPFLYRDKGSMATIGRAAAVAHLGKMQLTGFFAWLAWLFIHLMFLVGFRSRLAVLISWAWAYIAYKPAAQVIPELAVSAPTTAKRDIPDTETSAQEASAGQSLGTDLPAE